MERSIRLGAMVSCLMALAGLAGCAAESRRLADEGEGEAPGAPAASAEKTRVTVTSVDIEPRASGGRHVLTVKAVPPSTGWTIEIRPMAVSTAETREFEVVGRGPAASSRGKAAAQIVTAEIQLEDSVKHIVVYDVDDATVLEAP